VPQQPVACDSNEKTPTGSCSHDPVGVADAPLATMEEILTEAIVAEIMDYFSVPSVSGLALRESEARWIASGIVRNVRPDLAAKIH